MPETTFLHVQGTDGAPTRVFELAAGPVRLGRGPTCEVRLEGSGLADVQCLLQPRGDAWHLQPVGPPGQIWVDGRPADARRPLVFGVPFRVGDEWLTLRSPENATNDWGSFAAPITVGPAAEGPPDVPARPAVAAAAPTPPPIPERPRPGSAAPSGDADDRIRRWQSRVEARERWLKDQQEERRWEARWKAAGETIRARGATPDRTPPGSPPVPPRPAESRAADLRPPAPIRPVPGTGPGPDRRPFPSRDPVRPRALMPPEPPAAAARPEPLPARPPARDRPVVRPAPDLASRRHAPARVEEIRPPALGPRPVVAIPAARLAPADVPPAPGPDSPPSSGPAEEAAVVALPPVGAEPEARSGAPTTPGGPESPLLPIAPALLPTLPGRAWAEPVPAEVAVEAAPEPGTVRPAEPAPAEAVPEIEGEAGPGPEAAGPSVLEADWDEIPPFVADTFDSTPAMVWVEPTAWPEAEAETAPPTIDEAPAIAPRPAPEATPIEAPTPIPAADPTPRGVSAAPSPAGPSWPTARSIFAAQGRREAVAPPSGPARGRRAASPRPTEAMAPGQWTLPLWLGWFPTACVVLVLGPAGLALSVAWIGDATSGDLAERIATRPEGTAGPTIDPATIGPGPWWRTTSAHRAAWAVALERSGDGEDHSGERRDLIEEAANASRLGSRARFLVEEPEGAGGPGADDLSHLGRTRDFVALAGTGRRLRRLGKADAATRAYRSAFAIASGIARADLPAPAFDETPQSRRYALPHEAPLAGVARDMAGAGPWSPEQWAEALPRFSTAYLAAARAIRPVDPAGSDRLLDLATRLADEPPTGGLDPAEHRAGAAEALALRARWTDSAATYRLAIEGADDDTTRRMWSLNLAEIAQRLGDHAGRARALDAAKDVELGDEVTRRALQYSQMPSITADRASRP